jgi:hypothetical protein
MHERLGKAARAVKDFFDWRFVACLAVLLLTATLFYGAVKNNNQRDKLISAAQHSAARVEQLEDLLRKQQQLDAERAVTSAKRASTLRRQNHELATQLSLLVSFLKQQGLEVPAGFDSSFGTSGSSQRRAGTGSSPRAAAPTKPGRGKAKGYWKNHPQGHVRGRH